MKVKVLGILKQSCTGLTREEFLDKAKSEDIQHPLNELAKLIDEGLARVDQEPAPARFKATTAAFN